MGGPGNRIASRVWKGDSHMLDSYGRNINKLRVSLGESCNMACTYCVTSIKDHAPDPNALSSSDLLKLVSLLVQHSGIAKIRITGGEPLLHRDLLSFIDGVCQLGVESIGLTTNGLNLGKLAIPLKKAGLDSVNISLDSLNPENFRRLGRAGRLKRVLEGIEKALAADLRVKLNMVVIRDANDHEVVDLLEYAIARGIELRYLELMRMGPLFQTENFPLFTMQELLDQIGRHYTWCKVDAEHDATAQRYRVHGGHFGIIPNESEPFCSTCSRLRLTSNGQLVGCLSNPTPTSILHLLEKQEVAGELNERVAHSIAFKEPIAFTGSNLGMSRIGG
jgi:cyclic pyranopterin phosphate synthase